jgi:TetR/AcrR family transcriptional repressor of nem operon
MAKTSTTRSLLLEAGKQSFLERGYNGSGIEAILQAAGVPKGSFYHYFASKEDFGLQVLDCFAEDIRANFEVSRAKGSGSSLGRLRCYFEDAVTRLESRQCRNGCLVGNLSQELADQSEAFRERLEAIFAETSERYAMCFREAQEAGEIPPAWDVDALAEFCLSSWQGAILRAKAARSTRPIRTFIDILFGMIVGTAEPNPAR